MARKNEPITLDGLEKTLTGLGYPETREAQNLLRRAVHQIATGVQKAIKAKAPVGTEVPYFTPKGKAKSHKGILRNAIKAKRRRPRRIGPGPGRSFRSDVIVTRGREAKFDAFYWFWVEYGFRNNLSGEHVSGQNFIEPEKRKARNNFETLLNQRVKSELEKKIQQAIDR